MTHDEAFLNAIREAPDDDGPRLIYADWVEDHGDPARAELIRGQCRLARLDEGAAERGALEKHLRELLAAREKDWLPAELTAIGARAEFRRGFVERLSLDAQTFLQHADALFQAAPLVRLLRLEKPGRFV